MSNDQPRMPIASTVALYLVHRSLGVTGTGAAAGAVAIAMTRFPSLWSALRRIRCFKPHARQAFRQAVTQPAAQASARSAAQEFVHRFGHRLRLLELRQVPGLIDQFDLRAGNSLGK